MDLNRSIALVKEKGTGLELACLGWLLHRARPEPAEVHSLVSLHNRDGGFPCRRVPGNSSCVHQTLNALWRLDELGLLRSRSAERALRYLVRVQREDGGWDEDPAAADSGVPPWARPRDLAARVFLSAYAAYWLALGGHSGDRSVLEALAFLNLCQEESGRLAGFLHSTWIATAVFAMGGDPYTRAMESGLRFLTQHPMAGWVDSQIWWALDCLSRAGLPREHAFVAACLDELERRQGQNGGWVSEDGPEKIAGATLEALKVLQRYGFLEAG